MKRFMCVLSLVLAVGCAAQKSERAAQVELRNGVGLEGEWSEPQLETVEKALGRMERAMGKQVMDLSVTDDAAHFQPREDSHRHPETQTACFRQSALSSWYVIFERVRLYYDRRPEAKEAWRKVAGDVYGSVQEAETGGWRWKDGGRDPKNGLVEPAAGRSDDDDRAVLAATCYAALTGAWSPLESLKAASEKDPRFGLKLAQFKEDGVLTEADYQTLAASYLAPSKKEATPAVEPSKTTSDGRSPLVGWLILGGTLLLAGVILVWQFRKRRAAAVPAELPYVEEAPPADPGAEAPADAPVAEAVGEVPAEPVEEPRT